MARLLNSKTTSLYRTLVRRLVEVDSEERWTETVYGPYDCKSVNRDYDAQGDDWANAWQEKRDGKRQVFKQELKPVFNLTPEKGLVLGLEWVTYEQDGVRVHEH